MNKLSYKVALLACLFSLLTTGSVFSQETSFRFAWLTDIHIVRGSSHIGDLQKSVDDINSRLDVKFVILTGDISDFGYGADMKIAKSILDKLTKPYYIVPGNHDTKWSESGATVFSDIFGHRNISFTYGNFQFIGYQTGPILHRGDGYVTPHDFEWISKEVAAARAKGRIVIPYSHYPLTPSMSNWYKLSDLFKKYSVPVVLVGHGHRNQKMNFDGLPGVMARTNPASKSQRGDNPVGYTLVDISKDSIYFSESNPEEKKVTLWHQLPLRLTSYPDAPAHTPDLSVNSTYSQVSTRWKVNLPGGISSSPAYTDKAVFVGDRDGVFHALALNSGKKLWEYHTGKAIFSTPAIAGDRIVFGSADGFIYCLSAGSGKLYWKFKTDKWVLGSAVIDGNLSYIGGSDGKFRAIDINTGKLVWEHDGIDAWIQTRPLIYQGKVFFGAWDNYFYALDKKTGSLVWKWIRSAKEGSPSAFYAPAASWPVAGNGRVFITGPDMVLTAFDGQKGDTLWRVGRPRLNEAIGISGDGSKVLVKCTFDSSLIAYSATAGKPEVLWRTVVNYGFDDNESAIGEKGGTAIFTFRNGLAIAVDSETGHILWQHKLGDVMQNAATLISSKEALLSDVDGDLEYVSTP